MNTIILHGRIGKDPEVKEKNGANGPYKSVEFSFAVDRKYGDQTDWFRCEATNGNGTGNKLADILETYAHKGKPLIITGRMESYKTERDNATHWKVKIEAFDFYKEKKKNDDASTGGYAPSTASTSSNNTSTTASTTADTFEDIDEDVPF